MMYILLYLDWRPHENTLDIEIRVLKDQWDYRTSCELCVILLCFCFMYSFGLCQQFLYTLHTTCRVSYQCCGKLSISLVVFCWDMLVFCVTVCVFSSLFCIHPVLQYLSSFCTLFPCTVQYNLWQDSLCYLWAISSA